VTRGDGVTSEAVSCMACGRPLHDEESKRLRLGPHCRKRLQSLLASRPRRHLRYAPNHPKATPAAPLALELWDDDEDEDLADDGTHAIHDVPLAGSYL
jgi:hypothetical protein